MSCWNALLYKFILIKATLRNAFEIFFYHYLDIHWFLCFFHVMHYRVYFTYIHMSPLLTIHSQAFIDVFTPLRLESSLAMQYLLVCLLLMLSFPTVISVREGIYHLCFPRIQWEYGICPPIVNLFSPFINTSIIFTKIPSKSKTHVHIIHRILPRKRKHLQRGHNNVRLSNDDNNVGDAGGQSKWIPFYFIFFQKRT